MEQKINVIGENSHPDYFSKALSRAIAEIISRRIEELPSKIQDQAYSMLIDELTKR